MEEQLITLETAKLAKAKGFKVPVRHVQRGNDNFDEIEETDDYLSDHWEDRFLVQEGFIPVPTQSLLQKWLREEHGIDVLPISYLKVRGKYDCYLVYEGYEYPIQKGWFDNYEEAFEQGLIHGLKQI